MKKGFTMIELIFVIVILGILAAVAIPRLTATRDDAKAAALITQLSQSVSEIASIYIATGKAPALGEVDKDSGQVKDSQVSAYSKDLRDCITIGYKKAKVENNKVTAVDNASEGGPADYIAITKNNETESICRAMHSIPAFSEKYQDTLGIKDVSNMGLIKMGGTGLYDLAKDASK